MARTPRIASLPARPPSIIPAERGQTFSPGNQFFELGQKRVLVLVSCGKQGEPDDFPGLPVFRLVDGRVATFLNTVTQNVARDLQCFATSRVNLRRLKLGEDTGLAEGIDPNRLESRQIAGHAMDGGFDAFQIAVGRQSELRQQRGELRRRWFPHCPILEGMDGNSDSRPDYSMNGTVGCNASRIATIILLMGGLLGNPLHRPPLCARRICCLAFERHPSVGTRFARSRYAVLAGPTFQGLVEGGTNAEQK